MTPFYIILDGFCNIYVWKYLYTSTLDSYFKQMNFIVRETSSLSKTTKKRNIHYKRGKQFPNSINTSLSRRAFCESAPSPTTTTRVCNVYGAKINGFYAAFAKIFTATAVIVDIIYLNVVFAWALLTMHITHDNVNATNEDIFAKMVSIYTLTDRKNKRNVFGHRHIYMYTIYKSEATTTINGFLVFFMYIFVNLWK